MANINYNRTVLAGRLTADVELKTTQNGVSVCSFALAITRAANKEEVDFIDCVAWRHTAEFISKFFKKGSSLLIEGSLQKRSWTDNSGNKRYTTEVIADKAYFVDSKNDAQGTGTYTADQTPAPAFNAPQTPNFTPLSQDDDLPF